MFLGKSGGFEGVEGRIGEREGSGGKEEVSQEEGRGQREWRS